MSDGGKGSSPRPYSVDLDVYGHYRDWETDRKTHV